MRRTLSAGLLGVFAVAALGQTTSAPAPSATTKAAPKVRITIGEKTTRITGPLRADGYVDYTAAINGPWSRGVTEENNAAVILLGLSASREAAAWEYAQRAEAVLGYRIPTLKMYEKDLYATLGDARGEVVEKFAWRRPWAAEEASDAVEWLKGADPTIEKIVEASKRSRYFAPAVHEG